MKKEYLITLNPHHIDLNEYELKKDFKTKTKYLWNLQILEAFASSLIQRNVLMKKDIPNLTKYQIILARDQFRKNPSPNIVVGILK